MSPLAYRKTRKTTATVAGVIDGNVLHGSSSTITIDDAGLTSIACGAEAPGTARRIRCIAFQTVRAA